MAQARVANVEHDEPRDGRWPCSSETVIEAACAVLELDEYLTKMGVPYETRAHRLAQTRAVLSAWTAGVTTTEAAACALEALLMA
jgi:hypothetical protein